MSAGTPPQPFQPLAGILFAGHGKVKRAGGRGSPR